jgi:hypothetical protein
MGDTEENLNSQKGADPDLLFVEENSRYKLSFSLEDTQMECLAKIEIIPAEKPSTEEFLPTDTDQYSDLKDENDKEVRPRY